MSETMTTLHLDDPKTKAIFETMFSQRNLVPILGAGFTKDCPTDRARVPDADGFSAIMLECLATHVGPDAASLKGKPFTEIAEYFLNPSFVPTAISKELIRTSFLGVKLDLNKVDFLQCPWPYVYTLNIDDAIESNSIFKNKVVPNRRIAESAKSLPCVYKIHGDAAEELLYEETSKIIFSTGHYVRSLTSNVSMLNSLKTNLTEQNTLFVGCSLANEVDLLFSLAEYQGKFPKGRLSIYVTRSEPNRFDDARLSAHGINTILIVPDYPTFYSRISSWGKTVVSTAGRLAEAMRVTASSIQRLSRDRGENRSFLLREPTAPKDSLRLVLPAYCIERDIEAAVVHSSADSTLTLIRGRRFSGKTLLLRSIAAGAKAREVYFASSHTRVSLEMMTDLLNGENRLLLFDSNSLTSETANVLANNLRRLRAQASTAVVAVNRTEPDIAGPLVKYIEDRNDFEVDARLSPSEGARLNVELDLIGLLRFSQKKTLLENTFTLLKEYPEANSELISGRTLTEKEVELLLIVVVTDKAYSGIATALDIRIAELLTFCEKLAPIVDLVETRSGELRESRSRYKVINNSRTGLAMQVRSIIDSRGHRWLADRLLDLVTRLIRLPEFESIGHSMYMFDAVNQVLSQAIDRGDKTGYRPVVRALYEKLQPALSHSPDYWLQRAKAILSIEEDESQIVEGIGFATKCFKEAERERTIDNAEFLIALLHGKLCTVTEYRVSDHVCAAVKWFSQAIRNYARNVHYIQAMLERHWDRRSSFDLLCDHLQGPITDVALLPLKRDVDFLLSVRRSWQSSGTA